MINGLWCESITGWTFPLEKKYYGLWTGILARSNELDLNDLNHCNDGFVNSEHTWNGVVWITCGLLWFLSVV